MAQSQFENITIVLKHINFIFFINSAADAKKLCSSDQNGIKHIILSTVFIGTITLGDVTMSKPSVRIPKNTLTRSHTSSSSSSDDDDDNYILYDTSVDRLISPKYYVKYNKQEYCPKYIISLQWFNCLIGLLLIMKRSYS